MQTTLMCILEAAVIACIVVTCRYLIPWLKTKFSKETIDFVTIWVEEAVKAAEQKHGEGEGKAKKAEVVAFLTEILNAHGIKLTEAEIDTLIEAAVKQLKIELLYAES